MTGTWDNWDGFSAATGMDVPPSNINRDASKGSGFIIKEFIGPKI
jgi:hypothetical protein